MKKTAGRRSFYAFFCLRAWDGEFRAPARVPFFFCKKKGTKENRLDLRSKNPLRAVPNSDFPPLLADIAFRHRCRSKGLHLRSPARRLPRPLAPATVGVFRSYRRTPQAFPLGGRWRAAPDEGSPVPPAGAILFPKNQKGSTPAGCSLSVVLYLFFPLSATMPVRDRIDRAA